MSKSQDGGVPKRPKGADCKSAGSTPSLVRIQPPPPKNLGGNSSDGRASAFQAECRGFESRFPLQQVGGAVKDSKALLAQLAERILGKDEVSSSILEKGSIHRGSK